jgi:hypothetical protein
MQDQPAGLSDAEIAAEGAQALPDKEVVSILDLNADLDLAIDAAAPIDLAVAANANVAAPIDAAVGANILSEGSTAQALSDQGVLINQDVTADATANAVQDSTMDQGAADPGLQDTAPVQGATDPATSTTAPTQAGTVSAPGSLGDAAGGAVGGGAIGGVDPVGDTVGLPDPQTQVPNLTDGNLLNVDVDLNGDVGIAAPINGAVAANANVAAPIDAAVAANVGSVDSDAVAVAEQTAIINQGIDGSADASADQGSDISQP